MPFIFDCSQCKHKLFEIQDLSFIKVYNTERIGRLELLIKRKLGDMKCPYCGHELRIPPVNVIVKPAKIVEAAT